MIKLKRGKHLYFVQSMALNFNSENSFISPVIRHPDSSCYQSSIALNLLMGVSKFSGGLDYYGQT